MAIHKRFLKSLAVIGLAAILMTPFAGCGSKVLESGYTWVVTETTQLKSLAIAEGASITAPDGYRITMTVDGVEKPIKPGAYKGRIVLQVARNA
jgi:hypothetical protein